MNSLTAYVIFTAGILWYILKYNFHLHNFRFFYKLSKISQLNVILFWLVTITTYLTAAVISLKKFPNTEGITVALLLVVVYGVLFDTSYNHFPGKGFSAIVTATLFFVFDIERKENNYLYNTLLTIGVFYTSIYVCICIAEVKNIPDNTIDESDSHTSNTTNNKTSTLIDAF